MNDFQKTPIGRKFYESDIPRLILALEKIATKLDESNKLEERRFKLEEKLIRSKIKNISEKLSIRGNKDEI
jgi:hypothetical protein